MLREQHVEVDDELKFPWWDKHPLFHNIIDGVKTISKTFELDVSLVLLRTTGRESL